MPARIARSSVSIAKPHTAKPHTAKNKSKKRNLNAFAIASQQHPETYKVRKHRLGETEDNGPQRKRMHVEDGEEEDEDDGPSIARRSQARNISAGQSDGLDITHGSDSEGNEWRYGEVDDDDDESLNSDEAFGESDEERFEGFVFRGSSTTKNGPKKRKVPAGPSSSGNMDLDEGEDNEDDDDESLGSDAVDLATMLDDPVSDEEEDEEESEDNEDGESFGGFDEEDEQSDSPERAARLQDLITTLHPLEEAINNPKSRYEDSNEPSKPSDFAPAARDDDWGKFLPSGIDSTLKKTARLVQEAQPNRKGKNGKLDAPLPRRQQDKLDRTAASAKAKETLERWTETVKHNRRADHISFPLADPDAPGALIGTDRLVRNVAPATDLEREIASIMETTGMATENGKTEEEEILAFEQLKTNKMSLEEVQARTAELRKHRDLLFREEVRAKRIKKIKSKSYRRVHRKERERDAEKERAELIAAGVDLSEEERERNDRRRAEERMGAKHREGKWAKGMKASGRAVWDEDARAGVSEMARRNEELRRRIEGKTIRNEDSDADTDITSSEDEDDEFDEEDTEAVKKKRLQRQLDRINLAAKVGNGNSKLAGLAFIQRAEARRQAQNDDDARRLAREFVEENGDSVEESEEEPEIVGRKVFGPGVNAAAKPAIDTTKFTRGEFEEREDTPESEDNEVAGNVRIITGDKDAETPKSSASRKLPAQEFRKTLSRKHGAKMVEAPKQPSEAVVSKNSKQTASKPAPADDNDGWTVITSKNAATYGEGDDDTLEAESEPFFLRDTNLNHAIVSAAFGGDDVEAIFEAEKAAQVVDEGDKVIDNTLPGWGNWVGEGVSQRDQARHKGRFLSVEKGVDPKTRKDNKLDRVIISQARVKKNTKFLASSLPFPFEERRQYEASLRMPVGIGMTKGTVMDNTKPRVLVKKGAIIKPMDKPMI